MLLVLNLIECEESSDAPRHAIANLLLVFWGRCRSDNILYVFSMEVTTTEKDLSVSFAFNDMGLPLDKLSGITMEGASTITDELHGMAGETVKIHYIMALDSFIFPKYGPQ